MARKRDQEDRVDQPTKVRPKTSKAAGRPVLTREVANEIELGRRFMKEYREVFEKLAKT